MTARVAITTVLSSVTAKTTFVSAVTSGQYMTESYARVEKTGMYACSLTMKRTTMLCMSVLFSSNPGIENIVSRRGMTRTSLGGMRSGMDVRQYHESGGKSATHVKTVHFGPKAMHRPTMKDQIHADTTKKMFILSSIATYVQPF